MGWYCIIMTFYYDFSDIEHISYYSRLVVNIETVSNLLLANVGTMSYRARLGIYMAGEGLIEKNAQEFLQKFADRETTVVGNDVVNAEDDHDPNTGIDGGTINGVRYLLTNPFSETGKMVLGDGRVLEKLNVNIPDILYGDKRVYSRMEITPNLYFINGFLFGNLNDALENTAILGRVVPL